MPPPHYTLDLPHGAELMLQPTGHYVPSPVLANLLVTARSEYDWPKGTGAHVSQQNIRTLEASVAEKLATLTENSAHTIIVDISQWAGNNTNAHAAILNATATQKAAMQAAITELRMPGQEAQALDALCNMRGISLVIASKIFRFCAPQIAAADDRHASYFFNSLPLAVHGGNASNFVREWTNGRHTASRLATFNPPNYIRNRNEYVQNYLPLLAKIASALNALPASYNCAATNQTRSWTPADVEMAAYYWWACNGSR